MARGLRDGRRSLRSPSLYPATGPSGLCAQSSEKSRRLSTRPSTGQLPCMASTVRGGDGDYESEPSGEPTGPPCLRALGLYSGLVLVCLSGRVPVKPAWALGSAVAKRAPLKQNHFRPHRRLAGGGLDRALLMVCLWRCPLRPQHRRVLGRPIIILWLLSRTLHFSSLLPMLSRRSLVSPALLQRTCITQRISRLVASLKGLGVKTLRSVGS